SVSPRQFVRTFEADLLDRSVGRSDRLCSAAVEIRIRIVLLAPESSIDPFLQVDSKSPVTLPRIQVVQHFGDARRSLPGLLRIARNVDELRVQAVDLYDPVALREQILVRV